MIENIYLPENGSLTFRKEFPLVCGVAQKWFENEGVFQSFLTCLKSDASKINVSLNDVFLIGRKRPCVSNWILIFSMVFCRVERSCISWQSQQLHLRSVVIVNGCFFVEVDDLGFPRTLWAKIWKHQSHTYKHCSAPDPGHWRHTFKCSTKQHRPSRFPRGKSH